MKKPRLVDAIRAIDPEINFGSYLGNDPETIAWWDPPNKKIPSDQLLSKLAELQADYDSKQYQRDRASQYPSIQDQLDMQYHDAIDGTTTWKDAIAKVKADNPKPE
jgi:hypothetical protein